MNVIDFYKRVITSLKLSYTSDGFIQTSSSGVKKTISANNHPLVLPTKEHIDTSIDVDGDGNPVIIKTLYNPLNENIIKRDTSSLEKTLSIVEITLGNSFAYIGELLLMLASDTKYQNKTSIEVNKFLISLNEIVNRDINSKVDDKSIELWGKMYAKSFETDSYKKFLKIFLKKNGKYAGDKFNRLAVCNFPAYDVLISDDVSEFNLKLRKKDIVVFKLIYDYVFGSLKDVKNTINYGSNDGVSPAFISLFTMYLTIATRFNTVLKSLKHIDVDKYDSAFIKLDVTIDELDKLSKYSNDLYVIPSELEINKMKAHSVSSIANAESMISNAMNKQRPMVQGLVNDMSNVNNTVPEAVVEDNNPMSKALRNLNGRVLPTVDTIRNNINNGGMQGGIIHNPNMAPRQQPIQQGNPFLNNGMMPQQQVAPQYYQQPMQQHNQFVNNGMIPQQQQYYQQPMQQPMQQGNPFLNNGMIPQQQVAPQYYQQSMQPANGRVLGYDQNGSPIYG